jgi:hypothetical protein
MHDKHSSDFILDGGMMNIYEVSYNGILKHGMNTLHYMMAFLI